jgi:hypothetical protein
MFAAMRAGASAALAYVLPTRTMETAMTPRSAPSTAPSMNTAANINKKVSSVFNSGLARKTLVQLT